MSPAFVPTRNLYSVLLFARTQVGKMATKITTNDLQEIAEIFLSKGAIELEDQELIESLRQCGTSLSSADLRHIVQSVGSSLFELDCHSNSFLVRLEPKVKLSLRSLVDENLSFCFRYKQISLCEDYLSGRCNTKTVPCSYLHACRYFGDCWSPKCRRPHDFSRGANFRLVCRAQCQDLSPVLLFRLLQFKRQHVKKETTSTSVDLSCPAVVQNRPINIEDVKNFLRSNAFPVQQVLLSTTNSHFHRWRISLRDEQSKSLVGDDSSSSFVHF